MAKERPGRLLYWHCINGAGTEASDKRIQLEISRMLIRFNKIDARWIEKYKQYYGKNK